MVAGRTAKAGLSCANLRMGIKDGEVMIALDFGELFGIVEVAQAGADAGMQPCIRENHGCRDDRSGQWAAPRLVHAGDEGEALLP